MNHHAAALLGRLDAIAGSLERSGHALALIGLGSVGTDLGRLDAYSDLDFFAVVEPGYRDAFIGDLWWLQAAAPIAFAFQNTRDGSKVLFEDGIYAEFAVFTPEELARIPWDGGRVVWQRAGVDAIPAEPPAGPLPEADTTERIAGEILTNLYVGLTRLRRGERLSAYRFIQEFAVAGVLKLSSAIEPPAPGSADRFDLSRRFEQRHPRIAHHLPDFLPGYDRCPEAALAILEFLRRHVTVNAAIETRIRDLARAAAAAE